jgi:hypothetical protein
MNLASTDPKLSSWTAPPVLLFLISALVIPQCRANTPESALPADLPVVEAATLYAQSLEEVPANVTVIIAAEIRRYGYRLWPTLSAPFGVFT